ncbi:hypothetical protein Tco_0571815 [Tanacetum coccineum]
MRSALSNNQWIGRWINSSSPICSLDPKCESTACWCLSAELGQCSGVCITSMTMTYPQQLLRTVHVALLCVQNRATDRPTTSDMISMLLNDTIPAFFLGRAESRSTSNDIQPSDCSVNNMTITVAKGRQRDTLNKAMSAKSYEEKVPAHMKEENVAKLATLMQQLLSPQEAVEHFEREVSAKASAS